MIKNKKIARHSGLFIATLLLLAVPAAAAFRKPYQAQISAEGLLKLKGMQGQGTVNVNIITSFISMIPNAIPMGDYEDVEFRGFAIVSKEPNIKFDGLFTVQHYNFWVKFSAPKPFDVNITLGSYSVEGQLNIKIAEIQPPPSQITWVLMKGRVTNYGESEAFGGIMAHAKISESNNWTKVYGFFTTQTPPAENKPLNFTISYYTISLANVINTEIDNGENALYIEGYWNVYNRTCTITVIDTTEATLTITIKEIVKGAPGNLTATLDPAKFTLKIQGIETVSGKVTFYHYKFAQRLERGIPRCDFNKDRIINILDIVRLAKAHGSKLGFSNFEFDLDVNCDFVINIIDLATAAQEFGAEY